MARRPAEIVRSERLVSRRRDVRRQHMRKRRRVTFGVLTLLLLLGGGWALARSSLFALDGVDVAGTKVLTSGEVVQASGLHLGQNMFTLHADQVRVRIEQLPLVLHASVVRVHTTHIRIVIVERTPAFVLETLEGRWYLDARSTLLEEAVDPGTSLPTIRLDDWSDADTGDHVRTPALASAVQLWDALPPSLRTGPTVISATLPSGLTLIRPDYSIRFGGADRLTEKLQAVRLVIAKVRKTGERIIALDVRAPLRPAAELA